MIPRKAPPRKPAGRHKRAAPRADESPVRARPGRGDETRTQLVAAALDVIGRLGYEGASTREIAKAANANLAAIVYHFGGKEGLHVAVAEHIAASIGARMGPTLAAVAAPEAAANAKSARGALTRLIEAFADMILGAAEAERWARFIVREQMQPTAAFDVLYRILGGAAATATRQVAVALGQAESEEVRLRVLSFMGQVLVFRVAQAVVLRQLGWTTVGDAERAKIKTIIIGQIGHILDAEGKS